MAQALAIIAVANWICRVAKILQVRHRRLAVKNQDNKPVTKYMYWPSPIADTADAVIAAMDAATRLDLFARWRFASHMISRVRSGAIRMA